MMRSPIKTAITFLLLVATSFAFTSRAMEYILAIQVIVDAESEYAAVGTLVNTERKYADSPDLFADYYDNYFSKYYGNDYTTAVQCFMPIDDIAFDFVVSSEYIESYEVRHVAGGITGNEIWNVNETPIKMTEIFDSGNTGLAMDTAVVVLDCHTTVGEDRNWITNRAAQQYVFYTIKEIIAGDPELWPVGEEPKFIVEDGVYRKYRNYVPALNVQPDDAIYSDFIEGHRYIAVLHPLWGTQSNEVAGWDIAEQYDGDAIPYRLLDLTELEQKKGSPVTYEDYAYIVEDRFTQLLNTNHHKQELIYTQDMSMLPRFHDGTLYIAEGRAISLEDTGNVCVINAEYAERNGIKVGDSIEFSVDPNSMVFLGEAYSRELYTPLPNRRSSYA